MLEFADLVFNQMPLFIQMCVNHALHFVIDARRNDDFTVSRLQFQDERLSVIPLIGNHLIGGEVFNQLFGLRDVIAFAARQDEA